MKKFTLLLVVFCISMMAIAQEKYSSVVRKAIPAKTVK